MRYAPGMSEEDPKAQRATFTSMADCTKEDWVLIGAQFAAFAQKLPGRVLAHLRLLEGDYGGFPVDRLTHCLLAATLAHKDGRDEEYVVCALLHDIGDTLGTYNHPDVAGAILKPFVSEENLFMVEKHGIFQGYYFFHHINMNRNMRDAWKDHPHYARVEEFCSLYDGPAFDDKKETLPLSFFEPMVHRVLGSPKNSIYRTALEAE
jgi:predicted HD phosphohydrolase